jgi:hypothetical protein
VPEADSKVIMANLGGTANGICNRKVSLCQLFIFSVSYAHAAVIQMAVFGMNY